MKKHFFSVYTNWKDEMNDKNFEAEAATWTYCLSAYIYPWLRWIYDSMRLSAQLAQHFAWAGSLFFIYYVFNLLLSNAAAFGVKDYSG